MALWQAEHVAELLRRLDPAIEVSMVSTETFGDRRLDLSIPELGGKGVFSKEIQQLVLAGEADIAVHSAKDLQAITPDGLSIAAFTKRGDPRDAIVGSTMADLGPEAVVATGSNRRSALLLDMRADLKLQALRGNIATRLSKLGSVDALVMAAAAIDRLAIDGPVVERLDPAVFVPQVGQGALAIEVRSTDGEVAELVEAIDHRQTSLAVKAERAFLAELGGDCNLPAGAYAQVVADGGGTEPVISIRGVLAAEDLGRLQRAQESGPSVSDPGRLLARKLRKQLEASGPADDV